MQVQASTGAAIPASRRVGGTELVVTALYSACNQESVFEGGKLVHPKKLDAFNPHHDMPLEILDDDKEAASTLASSLRGAAALLRLAVQKLLPLLGATKKNLNVQIAELVETGTLSSVVQRALDSL